MEESETAEQSTETESPVPEDSDQPDLDQPDLDQPDPDQPDPESEAKKPDETSEPKTVKYEDLVEEQEYSSEEFDKFMQIYESTISRYSEGEIVNGRILSVDQKEVSIDIGFKSEGVVPLDEFGNIDDLKIGDEIEVYIDTLEDKEGQLILSRKKADFMRSWEKVVEMSETGETAKGRITRRIKGGMVVDLLGVEAFLPGSQIDVKPIRDFDALIGQEFEFKIVNVNQIRKNIVVSRRVLIEEDMKDQREKIISDLEKGQILEGVVKNITNFGVFIDLGGVDGLLHINDLSWGRIGHPSEIVSLDQKIDVMVLDYDENKNRISLGYKQLQPHPWEKVDEKFPVGKKISGKVVNIADYGAFMELEKGIEGLIHISEMSWTQHIKHPTQLLNLGDQIEVVILSVEKEEHKISLGLKQMQPDPWEKIELQYPVGTRHKGVVRNLTNFGAFVELEEGVDGLVHISDLSWTRKIRHPSEVIRKNDEIEVEVLAIDQDNRRISLGYKQIFDNPWDTLEDRYQVAVEIKGKVTRCIDKGVIVEIPNEVEGFVPISHLKKMEKPGFKRTSDAYKIDEDLDLIVIEFDKDNKRIVLSERSPEDLKEIPTLKEDEKIVKEKVKADEVLPPDIDIQKAIDDKAKSSKKETAEEAEPADKKKTDKKKTPKSKAAEAVEDKTEIADDSAEAVGKTEEAAKPEDVKPQDEAESESPSSEKTDEKAKKKKPAAPKKSAKTEDKADTKSKSKSKSKTVAKNKKEVSPASESSVAEDGDTETKKTTAKKKTEKKAKKTKSDKKEDTAES